MLHLKDQNFKAMNTNFLKVYKILKTMKQAKNIFISLV